MNIPKFLPKLTNLDISDTPQVTRTLDQKPLALSARKLDVYTSHYFSKEIDDLQITGAVLNEIAQLCPSFG